MFKSFIVVVSIFIIAAILVNNYLTDPTFKYLKDQADNYTKSDLPRDAEKCYITLRNSDSTNIDVHYDYVVAHYNIPRSERFGRHSLVKRDDKTIKNYYSDKTYSSDQQQHDLGWYCLGLCESIEDNYEKAAICYNQVTNRNLKCLNNSIGFINKHYGNLPEAEKYFRKEISNHGNIQSAYSNLIDVLIKNRKFDELNKLLKDSTTKKYFSYRSERSVYFLQGEIFSYSGILFSQLTSSLNKFGFFAALAILLTWLFFLRKIDVFELEKWRYLFITCFLGMVFSFGTYFITDAIHEFTDFTMNGNVLNDFFYSILGIGAVEELMKFVPFFIVMVFTKQVNEPIDFIIYASASALGFAFIENIMYFDVGGMSSISGRALSATISHMFDASVIGYGLMVCRYREKVNIYIAFLFAFALAALVHGFYDFWLINDYVSDFRFITGFFMIFTYFLYNIFISNALNNSNFFDSNKFINAEKLKRYLVFSLSFIMLLEYITMSFNFGPRIGNRVLFRTIFTGNLIIFTAFTFAEYFIEKGKWLPLLYSFNEKKKNTKKKKN